MRHLALLLAAGLFAAAAPSPGVYLLRQLSLIQPSRELAATFGSEPSLSHSRGIETFAFPVAPKGVDWPGRGSHAQHDSCDEHPAWSLQYREGKLQTVVVNLPALVEPDLILPDAKPRSVIAGSTPNSVRLLYWPAPDRVLIAPEVNGKLGQLILVRRDLVGVLYPEVAKELTEAR